MLINSAVSRSRRHLTHQGHVGVFPQRSPSLINTPCIRTIKCTSIWSQLPINRCSLICLIYKSESLKQPGLSRLVLHKESSQMFRPPLARARNIPMFKRPVKGLPRLKIKIKRSVDPKIDLYPSSHKELLKIHELVLQCLMLISFRALWIESQDIFQKYGWIILPSAVQVAPGNGVVCLQRSIIRTGSLTSAAPIDSHYWFLFLI